MDLTSVVAGCSFSAWAHKYQHECSPWPVDASSIPSSGDWRAFWMGLHLPLHACYVAKRTMNLWVVTSCLINWITYLILDPVVNLWVQGELMSTFVSVLMSIRLSYNFFFFVHPACQKGRHLHTQGPHATDINKKGYYGVLWYPPPPPVPITLLTGLEIQRYFAGRHFFCVFFLCTDSWFYYCSSHVSYSILLLFF